ncbi:hypothetical protein BC938DRAFT_482575 [Jimgerdemannia flammicorona]|uniref:Nudix hydrolase domain-containing protein n=1 Tax=Jimgerdemannia flammicorona TaxID=994334 RepID=A0A433QDM1_9FUNG|nr:hypothetical protein BC938DRAFT_482575 [Jimgerdemannia flammicorona]
MPRHRHVTTAFLLHNGLLLLLHRSDAVRTYPHHWAAVSGSMEPDDDGDPLRRALVEIREETSLDAEKVQLIRGARPLIIDAVERYDTMWHVHPFLFRLLGSPDEIVIDWEHDEYRWVPAEEMDGYQTVPNLAEALRRVYLPESVHAGLREIATDRSMGAQRMFVRALEILANCVRGNECRVYAKDARDLFVHWLNIAYHLTMARRSMRASIVCAVVGVLSKLRPLIDDSAVSELDNVVRQKRMDGLEAAAVETIYAASETSQRTEDRINQNLISYLLPAASTSAPASTSASASASVSASTSASEPAPILHLMTLSYSTTILSSLRTLIAHIAATPTPQRPTLHLTILESRPLNEGAKLAYDLSAQIPESALAHTHVQVITDAALATFLPLATHVLLGADRISGADASVVNKMGSLALAALARRVYDRPVIVVSSSDKIAGGEPENEENEAEEVTRVYDSEWWPSSGAVKVRNVYFERVETMLIDWFVMEIGVVDAATVRELWEARREDERIFEML